MRVLKNNLNIEMSMKTIEEKDDAIIAELARLREIGQYHDLFHLQKHRDDYYILSWYEDQETVRVEYFGRTTPRGFDSANTERVYRLLGLEARDAVSKANCLIDLLRAEIADQYFDLQAERAKSAALVEALEAIIYQDEVNGKGWENDPNSTYSRLCRALAAHKKGGTGE